MAQINKVKLPNGTTYDIVPSASDITIKSKLYFEAVSEDNVTYKKLVAEYVAPDPEDIDATGTLTVYDLDGNAMFTMDTSGNRFNLLRVVNTLIAGTLITSDVVKPSGSTWDGTNTSLTTAISLLNSTLTATYQILTLGYFSGYIIRLGKLRIISLYNGAGDQAAVEKTLDAIDKPVTNVRIGAWVLTGSNTYGSRFLYLDTNGKLYTDSMIARGGFTLVYIAQ